MTIEEVQALIDTPMPHEEYEIVKCAYLFSCFCGLRISDIIKLKWNDVFVDRGQYRLAVSMKKTKEPIYLPLSPEALKVDAGTWGQDSRRPCVRFAFWYQPAYQTMGQSRRNFQAIHLSYRPPHVRHNDADIWGPICTLYLNCSVIHL